MSPFSVNDSSLLLVLQITIRACPWLFLLISDPQSISKSCWLSFSVCPRREHFSQLVLLTIISLGKHWSPCCHLWSLKSVIFFSAPKYLFQNTNHICYSSTWNLPLISTSCLIQSNESLQWPTLDPPGLHQGKTSSPSLTCFSQMCLPAVPGLHQSHSLLRTLACDISSAWHSNFLDKLGGIDSGKLLLLPQC